MPKGCCIPGCTSNYISSLKTGEKPVSTFSFPRDDSLRAKWLSAIPRTGWSLTPHSAVCRLHFKDNDIINWYKSISPGKYIRTNIRLKPNSVPSIFPYLPVDVSAPSLEHCSYAILVIQSDESRKYITIERTPEDEECSTLSDSNTSLTRGHLSGNEYEYVPPSNNHSKSREYIAIERTPEDEECSTLSDSNTSLTMGHLSGNECEYVPPSNNHSKSREYITIERTPEDEECSTLSDSNTSLTMGHLSGNEYEYVPPSNNHSKIKTSKEVCASDGDKLSVVSDGHPKLKEEYSPVEDDSLEVKIEYTPISVIKEEAQISYNVEVSQNLNGIWDKTSAEHVADSKEPLLRCTICPYETSDETYFFVHKKIHRNIYSCDSCHYISGSAVKLKNHQKKRHMTLEDLLFYCGDCPFTSLQKNLLIIHRQREHLKRRIKRKMQCPNQDLKQCPKCSYTTSKNVHLVRHQMRVHNDPSFQCKSCKRLFLDEVEYEKHLLRNHDKIVHKTSGHGFKCDQCCYRTSKKAIFERHQQGHGRKKNIQK